MAEILLAVDFGGSYTSIFRKDCGLVLKEPTLLGAVMTENGYEVKVMGLSSEYALDEVQNAINDTLDNKILKAYIKVS